MSKPIIEAIRDYFKKCPELKDLEEISVDFLDKEAGSYSLEEVPTNPIVKRFVDGSRDCQYLFIFASRNFYSTDTNRQNIENLHLYEKIFNWLEANNDKGDFPDLGDGREPQSITALTGGYLFSVNDGKQNARYQIQCRLNYKERKTSNGTKET